nr:cold shock domain-containing protein [Pedobacter kyonggii]
MVPKEMGIIDYYNETEGFGKIRNDIGEEVLFYQSSQITGFSLKKGLKVSFNLHQTLSIAINVLIIEPKD